MYRSSISLFKFVILLFCPIFIIGCANSLTLKENTVPTPLIDKLPLSMAINYDNSLENAIAKLESQQYGSLKIDVIKAQSAGFDKVFLQLFKKTITVSATDTIPISYDGLMSIKLVDFDVLEQRKTKFTNSYFAKLSYDILIYDKNNDPILNIYVSGDGIAYDKDILSEKLILQASKIALRDVFASIILKLVEQLGKDSKIQSQQ